MDALTVRSRVAAILDAIKPKAVCDDCLCEILDLQARAQANKTRYLQGEFGFRRKQSTCARCGQERVVISKTTYLNHAVDEATKRS